MDLDVVQADTLRVYGFSLEETRPPTGVCLDGFPGAPHVGDGATLAVDAFHEEGPRLHCEEELVQQRRHRVVLVHQLGQRDTEEPSPSLEEDILIWSDNKRETERCARGGSRAPSAWCGISCGH